MGTQPHHILSAGTAGCTADYVQRYAQPDDVAHLEEHGGAGEGGDDDMSEDGSGSYLASSDDEEDEMAGKADD